MCAAPASRWAKYSASLPEPGSESELIEDFPQLTHEDVLACFGFAAERERRLLVLPAA